MYINELDGIFGTSNCQTWVKNIKRIDRQRDGAVFFSFEIFLKTQIQHG